LILEADRHAKPNNNHDPASRIAIFVARIFEHKRCVLRISLEVYEPDKLVSAEDLRAQ
jgi:hypothetical protein